MSNTGNVLDDITVAHLLKAIKPMQLVVMIGLLASMLGSAFALGKHWQQGRFDLAIAQLEKDNADLKAKNESLNNKVYFYRNKDAFLSLTSTLQLQASLRDVPHQDLFTCSGERQMLTDTQVDALFQNYQNLLDTIINDEKITSFYGPVSRVCAPKVINFELDGSAAYLMNNFISN